MKTAKLISIGGTKKVTPKNGEDFKLAELRSLIGCKYIEVLHLPGGKRIMILDEEGKFNGQKYNPEATKIVRGFIADTDFIVGPVVVCHVSQLK